MDEGKEIPTTTNPEVLPQSQEAFNDRPQSNPQAIPMQEHQDNITRREALKKIAIGAAVGGAALVASNPEPVQKLGEGIKKESKSIFDRFIDFINRGSRGARSNGPQTPIEKDAARENKSSPLNPNNPQETPITPTVTDQK